MTEEDDDDVFVFLLAERLHRSIGEILDLPRPELLAWRAYFEVRHVMGNLAQQTAEHRAALR